MPMDQLASLQSNNRCDVCKKPQPWDLQQESMLTAFSRHEFSMSLLPSPLFDTPWRELAQNKLRVETQRT